MDRQITSFIRALRSYDVRVSTGEALDATRAVSLIGYADRTHLKDALRCTLAKSPEEQVSFDDLFDLFFAEQNLHTKEQPETTELEVTSLTDPVALIESGDEAAISMRIEQAATAIDLDNIRFSTQVGYYAQQMVKQMGGNNLQARLLDALQSRRPAAENEAQRLMDIRRDLTERARERAKRAFEIFGRGETEQFRLSFAESKRLSEIDQHDMGRMKVLIARIAKRLAAKHSRRRRKKNRGQLDIRRTLRRSAGTDGIPFDVAWRQKKRDRPKIVVICDVSGSVARYVRFLLLLLWSMKDVIPKLHAFAFSGHLYCVDALLEKASFEDAMEEILRVAGMGSTSYGQAWTDFHADHFNILDRRTSIIILGDGRSNYDDPRTDLLREFSARTKQIIWLNPEGRPQWGAGDSVIPRYRPYCASMTHVATLKDLENAVDSILSTYT